MKNIWVLSVLLIVGCVTSTNVIKLNNYELAAAEGFTAYSFAWHRQVDEKEPEGNVKGCTCNGSKKVKSGDGLVTIPCPCGNNCTCKQNDLGSMPIGSTQKVEKYFILVSASKNCSACNDMNKVLKKNGWISKSEDREKYHYIHEDIGDLNKPNEEMLKKYNTGLVPTCIIFENEKEVRRLEGVPTAEELLQFWNGNLAKTSNYQASNNCVNGNCGTSRRRR